MIKFKFLLLPVCGWNADDANFYD